MVSSHAANARDDGLFALCGCLLDRCGLSPDVAALARSLLLINGLLRWLCNRSVAQRHHLLHSTRWCQDRAQPREQRVIQVVLLDMNGTACGEVSLKLPEEALIDANDDACYIVRRHHSSGFGGSSGAMLEPLDDDSAIFCKRELIHGQLHAHLCPRTGCALSRSSR